MAVADQDSGRRGRHVTARNESNPVLGQPGQHALVQRRLRLLHERFGIEVHTQDGPRRRRGDKMLLAPPVGGAERRQSAALRHVLEEVGTVASTDSTVLIHGETGNWKRIDRTRDP